MSGPIDQYTDNTISNHITLKTQIKIKCIAGFHKLQEKCARIVTERQEYQGGRMRERGREVWDKRVGE